MSGETTNYLGIILAVAGLFFVVVIASILMSCIKCCKKQLAKKPPPPSHLALPLQHGYGSTMQKSHIVSDIKGQQAGTGYTPEKTPETKQLHETWHKKTELSSGRGKHRRLGPSRSSEYDNSSQNFSLYNIDTRSVPDIQQDESPSYFSRRRSFESFPSSSGELGYSSSNEGQWLTPDEDYDDIRFMSLRKY